MGSSLWIMVMVLMLFLLFVAIVIKVFFFPDDFEKIKEANHRRYIMRQYEAEKDAYDVYQVVAAENVDEERRME